MKINHFICPNCGHDFYESGAYATCDGCRTFFYVSQSRTCTPTWPTWANSVVIVR
jgi:predicted amidophosphoribosyltransferase